DQPLHLPHRRHQPAPLGGVEGLEHRRRELVRKPVVSSALHASLARQTDAAPAAVSGLLLDRDQALRLQRLHEPAEIARIETELVAESADLNAVGACFENEPRLSQRAAPAQIIGLERPDALSDEAVETTNLLDLVPVHSLTLVRYLPTSSLAAAAVAPRAPGPNFDVCPAENRVSKRQASAANPQGRADFHERDGDQDAGDRIDCSKAANGVRVIVSATGAPPLRCNPHRGSRPQEKSVDPGASRGTVRHAKTLRAT